MGKIIVTDRVWERDFLWEGLPLLHCSCRLPHAESESRGPRRMERFWRNEEQQIRDWLEEYHARCCVLAREALDQSKPLPYFTVDIRYEISFQNEDLLSLLVTIRTAGKVKRISELWETEFGTPVSCKKLLGIQGRRRRKGRVCLLTDRGIVALGEEQDELLVPWKEIRWKT